jgi:hypothetical protein
MAREAAVGDGRSNRANINACSMARIAHTQQGIAQKQRPPGTRCLGRNQPTTSGLSHTHITTTHNHRTAATPNIHPTTHINTIRRYKLYHPTPASVSTKSTPPKSPQAPKQEDFADQPYRGVIHMITGGSSVDFETKRQKRDHYRSVNHVALTGPVVQTRWSHVPLTFDAMDVDLRSAPHIDTMVINYSVAS